MANNSHRRAMLAQMTANRNLSRARKAAGMNAGHEPGHKLVETEQTRRVALYAEGLEKTGRIPWLTRPSERDDD